MKFALSAIFILAASAFAGPVASDPQSGVSTISDLALNTTGSGIVLTPRTGAEVVSCYGFGTAADRAPIISVIDDFCRAVMGRWVPRGTTVWSRYYYGDFTVLVSGSALTNCGGFTIDNNCGRLLRLPVDHCNTGGENGKQGGYETDLCGQWRTDPGSNGSDV